MIGIFSFAAALIYQKDFPHYPSVSDEHGYVFLSETIQAGRLTNPPLDKDNQEFFETKNFNYLPTHHSKYPLGIALPYALSNFMGSKALRANVLLFTLSSLLLLGLLLSQLPFSFSALGVLLYCTNFRLIAEWVNGYRSGLLTMIGATLVLYIVLNQKLKLKFCSLLFALGAIFLMWSRPFEGLILCACVCFILAMRGELKSVLKISLPFIALSLCFHLYYNYQTTGDIFTHPHLAHARDYYSSSDFLLSGDKPIKSYSNDRLRRYYVEEYERPQWQEQRTKDGFLKWLTFKFHKYSQFYVSHKIEWLPILILMISPMLISLRVPLYFIIASLLTTLLTTTSGVTLYTAALAPLFFFLAANFFAKLGAHKWTRLPSILIFATLITLSSLSLIYSAGDFTLSRYLEKPSYLKMEYEYAYQKPALVFVHYSNEHSNYDEWVINSPEMAKQDVIYALDKGSENYKLLSQFPGRHAYLIELNNSTPFKLQEIKE